MSIEDSDLLSQRTEVTIPESRSIQRLLEHSFVLGKHEEDLSGCLLLWGRGGLG